MSTRPAWEASNPRRREAAEWFVEHESVQELPRARLAAWEDWVSDSSNRAEYAAIVYLRREMRALSRPCLPSRDALLEDSFNVDDPPVGAGLEGNGLALFRQLRTGWRRRSFAVAAGVAVLACLVSLPLVYWVLSSSGPALDSAQAYATGTGEQRAFTLADGSQMTLGGNTLAVVRFTASGRTVVLNRGEGLFHVQHDPNRSFIVCAAQACVTAVGTIFDVHLYSGRVRVWVQEGMVEIAPMRPDIVNSEVINSTARWSPLRLQHGQEMSYSADGEASAPGPTDAVVAAAWTQGSLLYHGRLLSEVIEDVQRYSARPILLDPTIANLRYSGSVIQSHVDQWMHALSDIFPVEIIDCRALSQTSSGDPPVPPPCHDDADRVLIRSRMTP
jgi:ferric-dicitrate binding protein FerR (iron transport regulator)